MIQYARRNEQAIGSLSTGHVYWAQKESETSVAKAKQPCRVRETVGSWVSTQLALDSFLMRPEAIARFLTWGYIDMTSFELALLRYRLLKRPWELSRQEMAAT